MKQDAQNAKRAHAREVKRARLKPKRRFSAVLPICISLLFGTFVYAAIQFGSVSQAKLLVSDSLAGGTAPRGHQSSFADTTLKQTLIERPSGISATPNFSGENTGQLAAHSDSNPPDARSDTQDLVSLLGYDPNADIIPSQSAPTAISTQTESSVLQYDGNNNLLSTVETLSDGSQKTELNQYDAWNRLTQSTDRNGRVQKYGYDNVGNQISYTDSDGIVTTREFDTKNRLVKVIHPTLGAVTLAYTGADELKTITHPNGTVTNRTYDLAGRLASITVNQGAVVVSQRVYTFDANGNRLTQIEQNGGAAETTTYEYDLDNRLMKVIGPDQTEIYTVDAAGNRKTEVVKNLSNVVLANKTYSYNSREQLLPVADGANTTSYLYDGNGNQTSVKVGAAPATQYIWNTRDQLASLSTGEAFEYDAAGHRTAKTGGGNRTLYIWSGDDLMAETNTIGNSFSQYTRAGSLLLGEVRNGVAQHFDQDAFNSIIVTTLADGTVPGRLSYRAFGQVRSLTGSVATPLRFNGYVSDGGDELSSPSRYYSLATGRFTSMDPVAPTQMDPMSWNAYVGLGANPMRNTDPSGRCFWDGCLLEYAALAGILAWEASVIHEEVTEHADFATAASNPRNIVNGAAVAGTVASGGLLGPLATGGVMVAGGGLSAAHQYVDTGTVTAGQTVRGGVLASGMVGGFMVGGVLAPAATQVGGVGLLGYSAADSGHRLGAGIANGDAPRSLLAVSDLALTFAGGGALYAMPKKSGAATPLTVAESSSGGSRLMASIDAELEIGISQKGIDVNHANVDIPFGAGVKQQGFAYEDYLATAQAAENRLAPGTRTFDFFDPATRAATSAKTLNTLSAAKLNNPKQVYSALRPYINATADFAVATIPNMKPLLNTMINSKTIKVAVPVGTTSAQWAQLKRAIDYATEHGVKLEIETANTKQ